MCEPTTLALLVGSAATTATATAAATAATAGLVGAGGALTMGGVLTGLSTAATAAGLMGQQQAAAGMSASNQRQADNLIASRNANAAQIMLQQREASGQAGQKINANNMSLREARSTALARAGPSGLSVDNLIAGMGVKGATYNESVFANLDRTTNALNNQLENVNTATSSGFNSMKTPDQPDYLGSALAIGNTLKKSDYFASK